MRLIFATMLLYSGAVLAAEGPTYNQDIRPLLSDRCFQCHGPDDKERKAGLQLDTFAGATADHDGVRAIVPGKPSESELLARVTAHDPDERMPPPELNKPAFTEAEIALIREWIEDGAEYEPHWAFIPPERSEVPDNASHPVDHFIDRALKQAELEAAPEADPNTLLRRMYLDTTGLLPPPERVAPFVAAHAKNADQAVAELADELLASPHYGERWGRHWLDQARYADSNGYSVDSLRQMWPYRDWVIASLNADMPFDQFTIEQIAGDQLPNATKAQKVASAFHRNTLINQEGGSDGEQFRNEAAVDRVNTTGAVWLGLTLGCAQCHTHKFDPITHRDYFSMFAFFNQGTDRNNRGATVQVEEGEMFELTPKSEETPKPEVLKPAKDGETQWEAFEVASAKTNTKATLEPQKDGSFRLTGDTPKNAIYTLQTTSKLEQVAAIQLKVIPDSTFPKNGPGTAGNGNFVLTDIEVKHDGKRVPIALAQADHSQPDYSIQDAIDPDAASGWAINVGRGTRVGVKMNAPHEAHFIFAKPIKTNGKPITIVMRHNRNEVYAIGRFALAASSSAPAKPKEWSKPAPPSKKPTGVALMVMQDLPADKHRTTYIHLRGDFLNHDKEVGPLKPDVPVIFPNRLPKAELHNRIELGKWLVDPDNPLTARVTMNRMWMRYFGKGIVETENDFGMQGSLPTHPELLDWLAVEFVEAGWSQKHMHRLILTSRAYRRSSRLTPGADDGPDPLNRLLARQNRNRVDAEIVRDAALSASGLLHPKLGGPGVYPPQPAGVYAFTQSRKGWNTSKGPDRYRRAMYTVFYRSAPYPTLTTFDAPDFGTACTMRARSNTPLQALTLANDEAMVELAHGLAKRIQSAAATDEERIKQAYAICFSRPPSAFEMKSLTAFLADGADWKELARVLVNTDEFITRE